MQGYRFILVLRTRKPVNIVKRRGTPCYLCVTDGKTASKAWLENRQPTQAELDDLIGDTVYNNTLYEHLSENAYSLVNKAEIQLMDPGEEFDLTVERLHEADKPLTSDDPDIQMRLDRIFKEYNDNIDHGKPVRDYQVRANITGSPISLAPYRLRDDIAMQVEDTLHEQVKRGVLRKSQSPWGAPVVPVLKADNKTYRVCQDYQKLNERTVRDEYPLPNIADIFARISLAQPTIFSTIDLKNGFQLLELHEDSRKFFAFKTGFGFYEPLVLQFGWTNSPGVFQRFMNELLYSIWRDGCIVIFIDDILVFSKSRELHEAILTDIMNLFGKRNVRINKQKCHLFQSSVEFLGYTLDARGLTQNEKNMQKLKKMTSPQNLNELRSVLGLANYYRTLIPEFAKICRTDLNHLLKNDVPWIWSEKQEMAFQTIKRLLTTRRILAHVQPNKPFALYTDASGYALGWALTQLFPEKINGTIKEVERVVTMDSKTMNDCQTRYSNTEQEMLGLVTALEKTKHLTRGQQITVYTDSHNLVSACKDVENPTKRASRMFVLKQDFHCTIVHIPGKKNTLADALSRVILTVPTLEEVPQPVNMTDKITGLLKTGVLHETVWPPVEDIASSTA